MLDRPRLLAILAGAAGGAIAIGSMEAFSIERAFPLFAIPFATSIVTVLGSPKAEPAQPRALVGGHLVSALVGLLVVKLCGPAPWAAAVAVGLAMVAMHLTGTSREALTKEVPGPSGGGDLEAFHTRCVLSRGKHANAACWYV